MIGQVQAGKSKPVYPVVGSLRNREVLQVGTLDYAAGSLRRPYSTETNRAGVLAFALAGYAADMVHLPESDLVWIGEAIVGPIAEYYGVDLDEVWNPNNDSSGYGYNAPQRIQDRDVWYAAGGLMTHQHAKDNTHWDMGQVNLARIAAAAQGPTYDHGGWTDEGDGVAVIEYREDRGGGLYVSKGYTVSAGEPIVPFGGARDPDFGPGSDASPGGDVVVRGVNEARTGVTLMDASTGAPVGDWFDLWSWMGAPEDERPVVLKARNVR